MPAWVIISNAWLEPFSGQLIEFSQNSLTLQNCILAALQVVMGVWARPTMQGVVADFHAGLGFVFGVRPIRQENDAMTGFSKKRCQVSELPRVVAVNE